MTCRRCDICRAEGAPFGYAPPPALRIAIRRPLYTCGAAACRDAAEAKRAALISRHDPLRRDDVAAPDPARAPAPDPAGRRAPPRDPRQAGLDL